MFSFLLFTGIAFNLREPFKTAWNIEVLYPSLNGEILSTFYYNFNLTTLEDNDDFSAVIYEGNFTESDDDLKGKKSIASFELKMIDDQEGSIEVNNVNVADFKFVDSFPYFLAAYGIYNQTFTYAANIINLATIHISLFSFEKKLFREIILTKYQPAHENIPWYIKYNNIIVGGGVFVVTFIALHLIDRIKKFLGMKDNSGVKDDHDEVRNQSKKKEKGGKEWEGGKTFISFTNVEVCCFLLYFLIAGLIAQGLLSLLQ